MAVDFTERARAYAFIYGEDAHKRFKPALSKSQWNSYIRANKPAIPRSKQLRDKIVRNGLKAERKMVYVGAYQRKLADLEAQKAISSGSGKIQAQREIDQLKQDYKSGTWELYLKNLNRTVSSRDTTVWDDLRDEYDTIESTGYGAPGNILGGGLNVTP